VSLLLNSLPDNEEIMIHEEEAGVDEMIEVTVEVEIVGAAVVDTIVAPHWKGTTEEEELIGIVIRESHNVGTIFEVEAEIVRRLHIEDTHQVDIVELLRLITEELRRLREEDMVVEADLARDLPEHMGRDRVEALSLGIVTKKGDVTKTIEMVEDVVLVPLEVMDAEVPREICIVLEEMIEVIVHE